MAYPERLMVDDATLLRALRAAVATGEPVCVDAGAGSVVSPDPCPLPRCDRRRGAASREEGWANFTEIPGGLPGVETRAGLAYQGVRDGTLSVERWVEAVARAPARVFAVAHRKGA